MLLEPAVPGLGECDVVRVVRLAAVDDQHEQVAIGRGRDRRLTLMRGRAGSPRRLETGYPGDSIQRASLSRSSERRLEAQRCHPGLDQVHLARTGLLDHRDQPRFAGALRPGHDDRQRLRAPRRDRPARSRAAGAVSRRY